MNDPTAGRRTWFNDSDDEGEEPTLLDIALDLAAAGVPVFPCSSDKRPAISKAQGGSGFRDATTDLDRVRELWDLAGPAAKLIGMPTGGASGVNIVDVDPRHNGDAWEIENSDRLGETKIHATPSGGRHYLFRHVEGVRNSAGKLAPGVDVRGEGGYACFPPSGGYRVIHEAEIAEWPDWLLPLVLKTSEPPPRPEASSYTSSDAVSDKRIQGFIRTALDRVANAQDGQKHQVLRDAALQIGGIADRAGLSDAEAVQMLIAALPSAKDWDNARRTAEWGLAEGRKREITLEDREQFRGGRGNGADGPAASPGGEGEPPPPEPDARPEPPPHPGSSGSTPPGAAWPEPVDFFSARNSQPPQLKERHAPPSLWPFIEDTAERMGAATSSVALAAIVACASAIHEDWQLQPKRYDFTWTEHARLWGAIVGRPGIMQSPIIAATTAPIVALDVAAHKEWAEQMASHRAALAEWKTGDKTEPEPKPPRKARHLVESCTVEALQEVLRDDADGKLYAPLGKVLVRQDELAEFLASMDKYSTSKGTDRGAYLRAYNGGRFSIDRIGRGSFVTNSWSAGLLGGIQPEPIQRFATKTIDDGLLQRMMLDVPGPQGEGVDRAPHPAANQMYRDIFPVLAALRPGRTADTRHPIAVALHRDAHAAREDINALVHVVSAMPDASPRLQSTFDKWTGLFARLCLVFHLVEIAAARVRGEIAPPIAVVPADIADRVRRYMRGILAPNLWRAETIIFDTRQTDHAAWIAGFILAQRLERIAARDVVQSYRALRSPEERDTLNRTMEGLCVFGWLAPVTRNDARPPVTWIVNPAVHVAFAEQAGAERARRHATKDSIARHVAALREDDGA